MILTVTLNPCVHQYISFAESDPARVTVRPVRASMNAGGKGLNAARVVHHLGGEVVALTTAGGLTGEMLRACVRREGVRAEFVETQAPTRLSTCILERNSGSFREYLEEGSDATEEEVRSLRQRFEQLLPDVDIVTLNGSSPGPLLDPLFAEFCHLARRAGRRVVLDSYGKPAEPAATVPPDWLRANREELVSTYGLDLRGGPEQLLQTTGCEGIVITDGPGQIRCVSRAGSYAARPPSAPEVNPVGSGDALTAAFAFALARGADVSEALRWGAAAGTANASRFAVCEFTAEECRDLLAQVFVEAVEETT